MSDTDVLDSDATLEDVEFDKILAALDLAAEDAKKSGDFLSYSTVLDIYLSDHTRYSYEEREQLLAQLLAVLTSDATIAREIGWDVPSVVLPYLDSSFDMRQPIRTAPCVYTVMKIFEVLAHDGNPKELFLKATELLGTLKVAPDANRSNAVKFYDIKLYCLFELITSCLRRIETMYPLRFLGMTVTAFINTVHLNPIANMEDATFMWKRMYAFVRNYTRPPMPTDSGMSPEELESVVRDEDYLQRKLLTAFLTECVSKILRQRVLGCSAGYFNLLDLEKLRKFEFTLNIPVVERMYELAQLLDMDLDSRFEEFVASSEKLVYSRKPPGSSSEDTLKADLRSPRALLNTPKGELEAPEGSSEQKTATKSQNSKVASSPDDVGDLFEALVVDYQNVFAHTLVDNKANTVTDSLAGVLILYSYAVVANEKFTVEMSPRQAIALGLRVIVPGLVHSGFSNRSLHDLAIFWSWYALQTAPSQKSIEVELAAVPSSVLRSYFQAILFVMLASSSGLYFRYVCLTLLTRYLCLCPEGVCYDFIMDSLRECPYESVKVALVGVFKELVTQDRTDADSDTAALAAMVEEVALGEDSAAVAGNAGSGMDAENGAEKAAAAPPLPHRSAVKRTKYVSLDASRVADLLDVVDGFVAGAFENVQEQGGNPGEVATVLAALNLLVLLRRSGIVESSDASRLADDVLAHIAAVEAQWSDEDPQGMLNAVRVLGITADRLRE